MGVLKQWLPYVLSGISAGGQYALIAVGYTMVYGILRLINFAHGDIFMVAGLIMVYLSATMPLYAALPAVVILTIALGFAVDWDPEGVVVIRSADKTTDDSKNDTSDGNNGGNSSSDQNNSNNNTGNDGQTAETAASWTFSGAGWGHSVGMSQWGAYAMAKQGFSYEDILKFYFTGIEISK